ncbi:MAG TPA: RAD55 family ATPase, partial [Polyangiaceae bacterium]|nr:RAD55 family ATPase [Polyangiaceae bacterium]
MSSNRPRMDRLATGSAALDRLLGGGLPVRSVNVIAGEPGAGKSLFALQMLFHLARQGKKGLYLTTLSEPSLKLVNYMQQFSFFEQRFIDHEIVFADLGSVLRSKGAAATLTEISERVEREEPAIVIIDSFKVFDDLSNSNEKLRRFGYEIGVRLMAWETTGFLLGEYGPEDVATNPLFSIV